MSLESSATKRLMPGEDPAEDRTIVRPTDEAAKRFEGEQKERRKQRDERKAAREEHAAKLETQREASLDGTDNEPSEVASE